MCRTVYICMYYGEDIAWVVGRSVGRSVVWWWWWYWCWALVSYICIIDEWENGDRE